MCPNFENVTYFALFNFYFDFSRMFQLSAVTLKPEVRASRSQHGPFQEKIAALVDKVGEKGVSLNLFFPENFKKVCEKFQSRTKKFTTLL